VPALVAGALVTLGSACAAPAAAPTNGRIVFQRFDPRVGTTRLYVVSADGRGLRAVTTPSGYDGDSQPDWSPDGRRIAFRRLVGLGTPNERPQVFVVGADGRGLRDLTASSCTGACVASEEPAWSPDGRRIAFERTLASSTVGRPPRVGIFVMNADGTHVRQLTQRSGTPRAEDHAPSWSPDGKRIAFMSANTTDKPVGASVIWVIDADGTHPRRVRTLSHTWRGAGAPAWSPDGKRLLYSTACWFGNCGQPPTGAQLFTVGVDGKDGAQLTHLAGNAFAPRWSPDGRGIVFVGNARVGSAGDVYTASADGGGVRRVTRAPDLSARGPDWGRTPSSQ